ncbi:MAG TPA: hypothetical protein VJT33_13380 [bacterium]|nr:hypothetical protein [bacterium]
MNPLPPRRPAAWRSAARGGAVRMVFSAVRLLLFAALGLGVIWLSIVASVWGLSAVLVALALVGLVALRTMSQLHAPESAGSARRQRRAFILTAVALIGFFVLLTLASQIWASH